MTDVVPLFDARRQYLAIKEEIDRAVLACLDSGWYILGDRLKDFEARFAGYVGAPHAVGCANGTDAIRLCLDAVGVRRGTDILTVPNTAIPTVMAIVDMGCTPVFVDVDAKTWNIDVTQLSWSVTSRTAAIVPVHLYGRPADMNAVVRFAAKADMRVVEDCAQAHGAMIDGRMAGNFGDAAAFSFYPTKNLGAMGDAGMCVTRDEAVAAKLRLLRHYGQSSRYKADLCGVNSRLDEIQAAILSVKLDHLEAWTARRIAIAGMFDAAFADLPLARPVELPGTRPVFHLYVVRAHRREEFMKHLESRGIMTQIHYPIPCHLQPALSMLDYREGSYPVAESLAKEVVSLPIFPEMTDGETNRVIEAVRSFF